MRREYQIVSEGMSGFTYEEIVFYMEGEIIKDDKGCFIFGFLIAASSASCQCLVTLSFAIDDNPVPLMLIYKSKHCCIETGRIFIFQSMRGIFKCGHFPVVQAAIQFFYY